MALKALDEAGLDYRIAYTSEFCQAQIAAVQADLAVAPLPISVISADMIHLGPDHGLPELGEYRMILAKRESSGLVEDALADHVLAGFKSISERGMRLFA
jgi:DNA-binding transcriptional LysR family regulator